MTNEIYEKLDDLAREFYDRFKINHGNLQVTYEYNDQLTIIIPATNDDFGPMQIHCEKDEIIVCLGEYFHRHFDGYINDYDLENENIKNESIKMRIIPDTLEFIQEVLADRVVLEVERSNDKLISAGITYSDISKGENIKIFPVNGILRKIFSTNINVIRNTWSSKYDTDRI